MPRRLCQAVVLTAIMLATLGAYLAVEYWRGPHAVVVTRTAWDEAIPFRPAWVWVYLCPYLLAPLIAASMSRQTFAWYLRRAVLLAVVALVIFMVLPTRTDRETIKHQAASLGEGPTARLYRNMVAIDEPGANAAPSLHVGLSGLLAWALIRDFPRWWWVIVPGIGLIWLSTLFTWQHHLIDVATGAGLALLFALTWRRVGTEVG